MAITSQDVHAVVGTWLTAFDALATVEDERADLINTIELYNEKHPRTLEAKVALEKLNPHFIECQRNLRRADVELRRLELIISLEKIQA
jgi:hypothetical protein